MADNLPNTPKLDELEKGEWPSFVKEIKMAATKSPMAADLLGQRRFRVRQGGSHRSTKRRAGEPARRRYRLVDANRRGTIRSLSLVRLDQDGEPRRRQRAWRPVEPAQHAGRGHAGDYGNQ